MAAYSVTLGRTRHVFASLGELLAKATPRRSGDELADVALADSLAYPLIPYEAAEVTRLILDTHDRAAFAPVASLSVGQFRDWLLRIAAKLAWLLAESARTGLSGVHLKDTQPSAHWERRLPAGFRL